MKVAILVSLFAPKWLGGVEIATQNIAKDLAQKGNDVCVITSCDKGLPLKSIEDNYSVRRIHYPKIKFFGIIIFWLKCFFVIKKYRPDIVHSQTIQMATPCFLAKKFFNISYIVYCHGSDVYLPWKFKKIISRLVLQNADAVVVLTQDMKKEIESFGFNLKNIFIISNGINIEEFKNFSKTDARRELKIQDTENITLFVGSLKVVKGVEYLIEAMNIVKERNQNVQLLIAGDGEQKERLKKLSEKLDVEDSIKFLGRVESSKIPEYMVASDVFVLPSLSEGLPVVVLEAMASGLPIIATKVRGVPEIVEDGQNGFLVDPKNPEQIAEKILFLMSHNNVRENISVNNKKDSEKYSWDLIVNQLIKVYQSCTIKK